LAASCRPVCCHSGTTGPVRSRRAGLGRRRFLLLSGGSIIVDNFARVWQDYPPCVMGIVPPWLAAGSGTTLRRGRRPRRGAATLSLGVGYLRLALAQGTLPSGTWRGTRRLSVECDASAAALGARVVVFPRWQLNGTPWSDLAPAGVVRVGLDRCSAGGAERLSVEGPGSPCSCATWTGGRGSAAAPSCPPGRRWTARCCTAGVS